MSLTVVVGGQYGSEGKGKLVSYLTCRARGEVAVVRCGGSNAGHTAEGNGRRITLRQLPSGAIDHGCLLLLAAGMQIDLEVLLREVEELDVSPERLVIDRNATLIEAFDADAERQLRLLERIGSTLTGTGAATARKVLRLDNVRRAADVSELRPYIGDVSARLAELLDRRAEVIVEGTQGAGLSLHHGPYPKVTSRDTTAAAFLSEAGLPPTRVDDVVVVLRTYPIRVAGESGPMHREIDWQTIQHRSGSSSSLSEYTSVTGRLRRVGDFDWPLAARAVQLNAPTALAVHGLDYLNHRDLSCQNFEQLSAESRRLIDELEVRLAVPVRYLFTGPAGTDLIDRGTRHEVPLISAPASRVR